MSDLNNLLRAIPGYEGYEVSKTGEVWSRRGKIGLLGTRGSSSVLTETRKKLKVFVNRKGYHKVTISTKAGIVARPRSVHVLVLLAFVGPRPDGCEGAHYDGDKSNNCLENLRWVSRKENGEDNARLGKSPTGKKNPHAILDEALVRRLVTEVESGFSLGYVAKKYGVTKATVWKIKEKKIWRHLWTH